MDVLEELQGATAAAAETAGPAVVGLRFGWRPASGVVIARDRVLTCAHAVRRDEVAVTFADGRRATGRPAAVDAAGDLAVIAVETGDAPAIAWREAPAELGTPVFALARLGDGALRVTSGAVSALGRSFRGPAGGPLVDAGGRLVGLSSVRLDGGLVLALAADADLHARGEALARGEAPVRRTLGVGVVSSRAARRMRRAVGLPERDGLLVREVQPDGPAAVAGVEVGDLIVAAAGTPVTSIDDLHAALDGAEGSGIGLALVRGESEREVVVRTIEADRG
jgi:serine protease Do